MTTDIDDLVEQLLFDVAIAGRRGLGAEEIDDAVTNHHEHQQASAISSGPSNAVNSIIIPEAAPGLDLDTLIDSVWQRLDQHPDVTVETAKVLQDDDNTQQVEDGSDTSDSAPYWVYASEERVWQAIAGHAVDHKRIPSKLFDILEAVAAAGPDGVLQPEVRKLTDQDKQSIPLRTDKLADRGYITKEKVQVPKMITSRLRLWRFSGDGSTPPADSSSNNVQPNSGHIDHLASFDSIVSTLQGNDGIALLEDVQHETDCTSKSKKKALLRCIDRLEACGMLRRTQARVEGENDEDGSDNIALCLQLLREPTQLDREAAKGWGGPVKLDAEGRRNAKSWVHRYNGPFQSSLDDATDEPDGDRPEAEEEEMPHVAEASQSLWSEPDTSVSYYHDTKPTQGIGEEVPAAVTTAPEITAPASGRTAPIQEPPQKKRRISADTDSQQAVLLSLTDSNSAKPDGPGVFFTTPPRNENRKRGRPKKSLIAVFKPPKLRDESQLMQEAALDETTSTSGPGAEPAFDVLQETTQVPNSARSPTGATPDAASTPAVPHSTFINESGTKPPAPVGADVETPNNHTLGQRRRREKEKAKKAMADAAAALPIDPSMLVDEPAPALNEVPNETRPPSKGSLGQKRRWANERARDVQAFAAPAQQFADPSPAAEPDPTAVTAHQFDDTSSAVDLSSIVDAPQNVSKKPSKASLGQLRRYERERAERARAQATPAQQTEDFYRTGGTAHAVDAPHEETPTTPQSLVAKLPLPLDLLRQLEERPDQAAERTLAHDSEKAAATETKALDDGGGGPDNQDKLEGRPLRMIEDVPTASSPMEDAQTVSRIQRSTRGNGPVPLLIFVPFEFQYEADPTAPIKWNTKKRTINYEGSTHTERVNILMDIVRTCNGVFPGAKEMFYPFTTVWLKNNPGTPDLRTVGRVVETLRRDGKLDKYEFLCPDGKGGGKIRDVLLEPGVDPSSEQVKDVQRKMIEAMPRMYMPPGINVDDKLRRKQKRARDDQSGEERTRKRRKLSTTEQSQADHVRNSDSNDEGFASDEAGADSMTPAGTPSATKDGPKKRGRPTGRPRWPSWRKDTGELSVGDNVAPLLSLLFSPQQVAHTPSGTIGTLNGVHSPPPPRASDGRRALSTDRTSGQKTVLGKRSANAMNADTNPATALLMTPGQSMFEPSGTFGTNDIVGLTPHTDSAGRGKRVKKSTEKAFKFQKTPKAVSSTERTPTKRAMSVNTSQLADDPEGLVSTEYTKRHPEQTWCHRGQGRWARVLLPSEILQKRAVKTPEATPITKPVTKPVTRPDMTDTAAKAAPYSKSHLYTEPQERVSTDYVNHHPDETWHHVGHGRWARGLPPPTASYKTAVKGPEAKAYLARIGTAEGKAKKHGAFVNGTQMKRNGEPWENQPVTVNGVRLKPLKDNATTMPPQAPQSRPSTPSSSVPTVEYEVPQPRPAPSPIESATDGQFGSDPTSTSLRMSFTTTPSNGLFQTVTASRALQQAAASATPFQPPLPTVVKRKRPYTYKSRKQLSTVGLDGIPIELDRASDDDYTQTSSPKRQRKESQVGQSPAKTKYTIDRIRLSTAAALVRSLSPAATAKDMRWDLVGLALGMDDMGAAAELQYRSITHYAQHAKFVNAVQEEMLEPFLVALERDELPKLDHVDLPQSDWPGLLRWAETNIVPLVTEESLKNAKKPAELQHPMPKAPKVEKLSVSRSIVDMTAVFPATRAPEPGNKSSDLDLKESLIMTKSWVRSNSATRDNVYDTKKAIEKLKALGEPILQAVPEMQESGTIRQLKKGRQRPGRNFEITQHAWEQFASWPGAADGPSYLRSLAAARTKITEHFAQNDTLQLDLSASEHETLVLGHMLAQGMLTMEVQLPERNDNIDAPFPKLNAWSYGGPRHDTRKVDRAVFDLPVVYAKTAAFSTQHSLRDIPVPCLPQALSGEALSRVPFWIDIHENLIFEIWEMVLASVVISVLKKPGITAKGVERAHCNKLWAWEIELVLEWMEKVGIAERFGAGEGWTVGEEWYCALAPEVVRTLPRDSQLVQQNS